MTIARLLTPAFLAPALAALVLAGCGNGGPKLPSLGLGSSDDAQVTTGATPEKPVTPEQRAAQVGATSARAEKCGYNFDPVRLKANYLASETQVGTPPDQIAKADKAYDRIRDAVSKAVAGDASYCNDAKTKIIKADLTRHLAGDYTPPVEQKVAQSGGLFAAPCDSCNKKLTADSFFDKTGAQRPKSASGY